MDALRKRKCSKQDADTNVSSLICIIMRDVRFYLTFHVNVQPVNLGIVIVICNDFNIMLGATIPACVTENSVWPLENVLVTAIIFIPLRYRDWSINLPEYNNKRFNIHAKALRTLICRNSKLNIIISNATFYFL